MANLQIRFDAQMYVFAAEDISYNGEFPTTVKSLSVFIPSVCLDKPTNKQVNLKMATEDRNIFINRIKPSLSQNIVSKNYLVLPVTTPIVISSHSNDIKKGDRFIASFINGNPDNGCIMSRS